MTVSQSLTFLSDISMFAIEALHQNHSDMSFAEIIERSNYIRDGLIHFGLSADDVDKLFAASAAIHGPLPHVHQPKAEEPTQCAFCGAGAFDDIHYTGGPGTGKGPALKAMVGTLGSVGGVQFIEEAEFNRVARESHAAYDKDDEAHDRSADPYKPGDLDT